jgi:hypothetical protein
VLNRFNPPRTHYPTTVRERVRTLTGIVQRVAVLSYQESLSATQGQFVNLNLGTPTGALAGDILTVSVEPLEPAYSDVNGSVLMYDGGIVERSLPSPMLLRSTLNPFGDVPQWGDGSDGDVGGAGAVVVRPTQRHSSGHHFSGRRPLHSASVQIVKRGDPTARHSPGGGKDHGRTARSLEALRGCASVFGEPQMSAVEAIRGTR